MEEPAEFITVPADPKYHRLLTVCLFQMRRISFRHINLVFVVVVVLVVILLLCPPGDLAATPVGSAVRLAWKISP